MHLGDEEVEKLMGHFNAACEKFSDVPRPEIMLLRHTYVADSEEDAQLVLQMKLIRSIITSALGLKMSAKFIKV